MIRAAWLAIWQHAEHATARASLAEYAVVFVAVAVTVVAFVLAVKYTVRPGEENADHIKRTILEDQRKRP